MEIVSNNNHCIPFKITFLTFLYAYSCIKNVLPLAMDYDAPGAACITFLFEQYFFLISLFATIDTEAYGGPYLPKRF